MSFEKVKLVDASLAQARRPHLNPTSEALRTLYNYWKHGQIFRYRPLYVYRTYTQQGPKHPGRMPTALPDHPVVPPPPRFASSVA